MLLVINMLGTLGMSAHHAVTPELCLEGMLYHKETPAHQAKEMLIHVGICCYGE